MLTKHETSVNNAPVLNFLLGAPLMATLMELLFPVPIFPYIQHRRSETSRCFVVVAVRVFT
jgi:hypothetical protein